MKLINRYRNYVRKTCHQMLDGDEILNESRALMELTTYIERAVASETLLFLLSENTFYVCRSPSGPWP